MRKFYCSIMAGLLLAILSSCGGGGGGGNSAQSGGGGVMALPSAPRLAFSDLISGPATGLGDGLGSGVIVTVWGQNLGASQGTNKIEFCDSTSTCRAGHVYYWKNADGALPGGPANLYASHKMQEIAFSIPRSATGAGIIKVTTAKGYSSLPFTVRTGKIYFVQSTGNDITGDGSWGNPWLTAQKATNSAPAGSTIYIGNVLSGSEFTGTAIFNDKAGAQSSLAAQFAYVAYPGTRPELWGYNGIRGWNGGNPVTGLIESKLSVYASNNDEDVNGQPINQHNYTTWGIYGSSDGRTIGNFVTDTYPTDTTGGCPTGFSAAIVGNSLSGDKISNWKVFGNEIKGYGCKGTNHQQHTMYFSIRDNTGLFNKPAPEVAYNYLKDNEAAGAVRYYDEDLSGNNKCGQFSTTFKMHDNVVVNQAGEGLGMGAHCNVNTTFEFYNNLLINVGLRSDWNPVTGVVKGSHTDAVFLTPSTAQTGNVYFYNNTIYGWGSDNFGSNGTYACIGFDSMNAVMNIHWNDNICYTATDRWFVHSSYQGNSLELRTAGSGNVWYSPVAFPVVAIPPAWDATKIIADPLLTVTGSKVSVGAGSPIINKSSTTLAHGLYGFARGRHSEVGAVSYQ